jgi:hypothetical protein
MRYLRDSDRQALQLAGDLEKAIQQWLGRRGVNGACTISPYVGPDGRPAVLVKMDGHVAGAMVTGLNQPRDHDVPRP